MKILPPTMRERKRYLAFELISADEIRREDLLREMFSCSGSLLGDVGSSECSIRLLKFEDSKGIIRCRYNSTEKTRAILATINSINDKRVTIHVLGISGTVAGATKKYLEGVDVFNPE